MEQSNKKPVKGEIEGLPIGRDKTVVPPDMVQELAALGCSNREIANFFGVHETNISRHFAANLTKGREELKITLRRAMLKNACVNMNAAVQIFLAKNILGMTDQPLQTEANAPLPWTDDEDDDFEVTEEHKEKIQEELDNLPPEE
jgi:DNA-directed RNA polymerase specialized sigma24 family protein